jgi:L-2-hydroxyglutarate oxidase LhgO
MEKTQITIIGAGVVGLAIAAELSQKYQDILVVEQHDAFGRETSSRNSEVIHAGIYYPQNSLKARLCIEGRKMLYAFCAQNQVPHKRIEKLIVAANPGELEDLASRHGKWRRRTAVAY